MPSSKPLKQIKSEQIEVLLSLADQVNFNLFLRISEAMDAIILCSAEGDFLSMQNPGRQIWLYISESCMPARIQELLQEFTSRHYAGNGLSVVCSVPIFQYLQPILLQQYGDRISHGMNMNAYHCPAVQVKKSVSGEMIKAEHAHLAIVSEFMAGFMYDCWSTTFTPESQIKRCETMISENRLYLWQDMGKICSMANITHIAKGFARINCVYTPPYERGKGYAQATISLLSQKILDSGITPMLYADSINKSSNQVYLNCGYHLSGALQEINILPLSE